jgi:predicted nucleic acid-binding Zn ribbon protein
MSLAFARPRHCSECGHGIAQPATGRTRLTCSEACGAARQSRAKREARRWMRQAALPGPGLAEFEAWRKGGTP